MHIFRCFVSVLLFAFFTALSFGQETAEEHIDAVQKLVERVERYSGETNQEGLSDQKLVELGIEGDALDDELIKYGVALSSRITEIKARLDQIGPVPEEGAGEEPLSLQEERRSLTQERGQINQLLGKLEEQSIRTKKIGDQISEQRMQLFTETLSRRYDIRQAFSSEVVQDVGERINSIASRIRSWWQFTWRFKSTNAMVGIGAILALTLAAMWGARSPFATWIHRDPETPEPSYFLKLTMAFWYTIIPTAVIWLFLALTFLIFKTLGLLRDDIGQILATIFACFGILMLVWRLTEAVFAPKLKQWRLIEMSNYAAGPLKIFVVAMALVSVTDVLVTQLNSIIGASVPITVTKSLITSLAVGVLLTLIAFLKPFERFDEAQKVVKAGWPRSIKLVLATAGAGLIIAALAGYIGFARFAAQQIVVTGAVLATMYLGYKATRAISAESAFINTRIGNKLLKEHHFSEVTVDQIGLISGLLLMVLVLAAGLPLLALMWGFQWLDIQRFFIQFFTDIKIGSISLSITSILIGILLFAAGLLLTRYFRKWLDGSILKRSRIDVGARNSISTAVGYVGVAIAGLLGISAAGFELSQLALVAGALSLGIGFGLQNVVSNFVSGLILLAERPFKAGDIVEAGGFTGVVKVVKVRATEIETFDKKTLVLPNSEMINSAVINWMHKTALGRISVSVGVSYDSDAQQVHDLLIEIVNDHPLVLANPKPFVDFQNFGPSALEFVVRSFIADVGLSIQVMTELRITIHQRFKEKGIGMPYPQRDVNLKIVDGDLKQVLKQAPEIVSGAVKSAPTPDLDD